MDKWLVLSILWLLLLAALLVAGAVASYLRLLMRRLTPVGARKLFRRSAGRKLAPDRERVGVSISALHGAAMHLFAIGVAGLLILRRPGHLWEDLGTAVLVVLGAVAIADQLIPFLLVARHDEPDPILEHWMPVLRLAVFLALPLTFPILVSTTIARLLEPTEPEPDPAARDDAQEPLQELIEAGEQEGLLEKGEGELVQSVVDFGDKTVRQVMTPRPEIAAIEVSASLEDFRKLFREKPYTRFLAYAGQLDNVEGIVSVRDLMELSPEEQAKVTLRSQVRPAPFVPETKPIKELLRELQQSTTQMAVVIDEYGRVSGLVTIEDILEEIVGEIRDEVEPHAQDIVKESASSYIVAGHTELAQLVDQLNVSIEGRDYSTVAGLVMTHLGHVPTAGEKVEEHGLTFEVLEANQRTVLKVRMKISPASSAAPANA
jgi:CBS domain containing-hemolysin-like protein